MTAGDESVDPDLADVFAGDPLYPALAAAGIDCRHVVPFPETYEGAAVHTYGGSDEDGSGDGGDAEGTDATPPSYPLEGFESALAGAFAAADEPPSCTPTCRRSIRPPTPPAPRATSTGRPSRRPSGRSSGRSRGLPRTRRTPPARRS